MLAYIQKHHGEFANINTLTASLGFREKGYEIRTFELEELAGLPLTPETPVAGGIPVVVQALSQLGFHAPEMPSIPSSLAPYSDRRTWTTVMEEARALVNAGQPVFVKPVAADRKLFAGTVFREFKDTIPTAHVQPNQPVICSEVVEFLSEYRAFVLDGEILGLKHYKGDFRIFPDPRRIDEAVAAYTDAPSAYGIDFGVVPDGRTLLVETNEAYSLGCYGLTPLYYSTLLERRWQELTHRHDI